MRCCQGYIHKSVCPHIVSVLTNYQQLSDVILRLYLMRIIMKGITDSLFLEVAELSVSSAFLVLSWLPSNWKLVGCTDRQVTSDMEWVTCTDGLSGLGQLYRLLNHFWYGVGQLYRQLIRNGSDVQIAKLLLIIMEWVSCTDSLLGLGQMYRLPSYFW